MKNRHRVSQVVNKLICSRRFGSITDVYVGTTYRGQRGEADAYGSNCNVKLIALHRLKPSSNAKSHVGSITTVASLQSMGHRAAYVRPRRGATNPHTAKIIIAPTIAPMKPAFSPA